MTHPTTTNLYGIGVGTTSTGPFITIFQARNPTSNDVNYLVQQLWFNSATGYLWILSGFTTIGGYNQAVWQNISTGVADIASITTPDSVVVVPVANNINFLNGSAMSITGAGDNITFNSTGGGLVWNEILTVSSAMIANNGYIANNTALVTLTLPATCPQGSVFKIAGKGSGGWEMNYNSGQVVYFGDQVTTISTGYLASTYRRDCIEILCITANEEFEILNSDGDITVV